MRKRIAGSIVALLWLGATPAMAQHTDHAAHTGGGAIKALTQQQIDAYLNGAGMGLAVPAELNRYPGPLHAIEHADVLGLSSDQLARIRSIRAGVVEKAKALGTRIVGLERELDGLFANGHATAPEVTRVTAEIARVHGELRAVHLVAHIETRALLSPDQIAKYETARGR
jgi:hypothetical protein